jgi:hypothetical protein
MSIRHRRQSGSGWLRWLLACALLPCLASCGTSKIQLNYPLEQVDFSLVGVPTPSVFLSQVQDLRPGAQREGQGRLFGITYPGDSAWQSPVAEIYREVLVRDLTQTHLVEMVPLTNQAEYVLSADILSLGCRLERSPVSFVLPLAAGMGVGLAVGHDSSDKVRSGAVIGLAALLALPLPSVHHAEAEVRMTLTDREGRVVWQETCLGELSDNVYVTATARDDQKLVDKYLVRAIKRCNGCLLGQLRQDLLVLHE